MARGGVEPPTFRFSVGRSYQLSYLAVCPVFLGAGEQYQGCGGLLSMAPTAGRLSRCGCVVVD